jgi:tripartite-type tricarboxylate transporter receptor subunit TctC
MGIQTVSRVALVVAALVAAIGGAQAQNYPTRPIKVVVPYPAGGVLDSLTRAIGERIRPILGQPWIIENKAGAGGGVGLQSCASSEPDGYTFCAVTVESLTIIPHYDPVLYERFKTLVPVTEFARGLGVAYANANVPARDLRELVALARKNPTELRYSSFGAGSAPQLLYEWLKKSENVEIQHVPHKGAQDALSEVLAGRIQASYVAVGLVMPHFKSGALKPLAVIDTVRSPLLPDVPSMTELGFKFPGMRVWFGLAAPQGTPPEMIEIMAKAVHKAVNDPELKSKFLDPQGFTAVGSSPKDFAAKVKAESAEGAELIQLSGVRAQ